MALLATFASLPPALHAAPPPGRLLASQCAQCHGTDGRAVSGFESIAGKSVSELYEELVEMRSKRVEGIMSLQVRAYTDAQLRLIAEYLSKLPGGDGGSDVGDDD